MTMRHLLIDHATATHPLGTPGQPRLFRVPAGPFAGRLFAIYARTPSDIAWTWSDPPHVLWADPVDVITDAADQPFAALMDAAGHVYVAYTQDSTGALIAQKLTFASGVWAAQSPATVYESETSVNRVPAILKDLYSRIWVAWARDDEGDVTWRVKRSIDDGQSFGSGPSDTGTDLTGNVASAAGVLIARGTEIHSLHVTDGETLWNRRIGLDELLWGSAESLYTGDGLSAALHAAVSPDAMLGVVFAADSALWLREFDGVTWRPALMVADEESESPNLRYIGTTPHVLYLADIGNGQMEYRTSHPAGGQFTDPIPVLGHATRLESVLLLDADAPAPFADRTVEAGSDSPADISHPASNALLSEDGDAVYFGNDTRFSFLRIILDTAGEDGVVSWAFWNGDDWEEFIPQSGAFHFDTSNVAVRLFTDADSTPADWQKTTVDGRLAYWVRAEVQTPFTTAPIGTQITAAPNTTIILPLRG